MLYGPRLLAVIVCPYVVRMELDTRSVGKKLCVNDAACMIALNTNEAVITSSRRYVHYLRRILEAMLLNLAHENNWCE